MARLRTQSFIDVFMCQQICIHIQTLPHFSTRTRSLLSLRGQNKHPSLKVDAKTNSFGTRTQRSTRAANKESLVALAGAATMALISNGDSLKLFRLIKLRKSGLRPARHRRRRKLLEYGQHSN